MAERPPSSDQPLNAGAVVPWECVERFVGKLTHDVRNGLNALELQLTYLGEICADPEAAAETKRLRASLGAVTRQLQAIRVAVDAPAPHRMDYPAEEFFADLRERYERLGTHARVTWRISLPGASLAVDPELTSVALLEILGNAAHFGGELPDFTVDAHPAGPASIKVTVTERKGPEVLSIPTAGWGVEPLRSTRRNAYGLGLFRAARILKAQGGDLSAAFSAPERTLITTITLPSAFVA